MYDKYPEYDVPQSNIVQLFFAQHWSAVLIEMVLAIVITVAAGQFFDIFEPLDPAAQPPAAAVDARPAADEAASGAPSLDAIKARGLAHLQGGQYAEAEGLYDLALRIRPQDADSYAGRGYARLRAGDYIGAYYDYRVLAELQPDSFEAHNALCWVQGELRQFELARGHCQRALELSPSPPAAALAYENRCWLFVEMADYEAAYRDCMQVFAVQPHCGQPEVCALAHFNVGRIMLAMDAADEAVGHFGRARQLGSSYADMYFEMAQSYAILGYHAAARASYEEYAKLTGQSGNSVAQ